MVGFFALNVPSGLGIYWVVNNLFSTAATLLIKKQVAASMPGVDAAPSTSPRTSAASIPQSTLKPITDDETPTEESDGDMMVEFGGLKEVEGFASSSISEDDDPFTGSRSKRSKRKKKGQKKKGKR